MTIDSFTPGSDWARAAGPASPGLIFRAIPDDRMGRLKPRADGPPQVIYPNCMVLRPEIMRMLRVTGRLLWFPTVKPVTFDNIGWIVNMCADADEYARALAELSAAIEGTPVPVFNHPDGIRRSRRDKVSEVLEGIEGLVVPRCTRFYPKVPGDFPAHFEAEGFDYPVLVRPQNSQTGQGLILVEGPDDWDLVHTVAWTGKASFMTQYHEFAKKDGQYTKYRMVLVNRDIYPRSAFRGDDWLVHGAKRTEAVVRREFADLNAVLDNPQLEAVMLEIADRLRINFFGVDFGLKEDGRLVLFEANAAMSILADYNTPDEVRPMMQEHIYGPISQALIRALKDPTKWAPWPDPGPGNRLEQNGKSRIAHRPALGAP